MKTTTVAEAEKSILDTMLEDAAANETTKKTLTEAAAIVLVDKHFSEVTSKNGMLKLLRGMGFSIAMSRLFTIYTNYEKAFNKAKPVEAKPAETKETK